MGRNIESNCQWWQTRDSWNLTYYQSAWAERTIEDDINAEISLQEIGQLYAEYAFYFLSCGHEIDRRA